MSARRGGAARGAVIPLLFLGLAACGEDGVPTEQAAAPQATGPAALENHAPVVEQVLLEPRDPTSGQEVRATVTASDADGDRLRMLFSWSVNGEVQEVGRSPSFRPVNLRAGDRLAVEVVASDGRLESEPFRATASAGNRPPSILAVRLTPADPVRPGQTVEALPEAEDPDDDRLRFEYRWFVNGDARGRGGKTFDTSSLRRGDKLQVSVVASDGRERSSSLRSAEIELANSPPVFSGVPRRQEVDGVFFYQLEARDPDGDRSLRYRLTEGPPGMSIDPLSGMLRWQPGASHAGTHPIQVVVRDRLGDETFLSWNLTVSIDNAPAALAP